MRKSRIAVLALTLVLIAGAMSVFADGYSHKMTISAGNGSFATDPGDGIKSIEVTTGTDATLTVNDGTPIAITAPENHFVAGIRLAGQDNADTQTYVGKQTLGNDDEEYVVAYGLTSNMVKFKVLYRDAATGGSVAGLPESEEFVGVAGTRPVISWRYAEGYLPQSYKLTSDPLDTTSEKEYTFWYYKVDAQGNVITVVDGAPAGAAAAAAAAAGGPAGAGVVIGDDGTPLADGPQDTVNIDNGETPTTDPSLIEDDKTPGTNWAAVGGIGVAVAAVIAAIIALLRRRRNEDEDEDEI